MESAMTYLNEYNKSKQRNCTWDTPQQERIFEHCWSRLWASSCRRCSTCVVMA